MPAFGSEFIVVGRTLAAIVVHAPDPALSIGFLEGAGTTLTYNRDRDRYYASLRSADLAGTYTQWLEYFLGGFAFQLSAIKNRAVKLSRGVTEAVASVEE